MACYFTFLRRLIILNFILSSVAAFFYILPHFTAVDPIPEIYQNQNRTNCEYPIPKAPSTFFDEFLLFFAGQGILESSPLFYGQGSKSHYVIITRHYVIEKKLNNDQTTGSIMEYRTEVVS